MILGLKIITVLFSLYMIWDCYYSQKSYAVEVINSLVADFHVNSTASNKEDVVMLKTKRISWNKGLTRKTNTIVDKYSKKKEGIKRSEKTKAKISATLLKSGGHKIDCQCPFCKAKRGETKGKNSPSYRGNKTFCKECGKEISYVSTFCSICWYMHNQKENHCMYGKHHSKKSIQKMSDSHVGLDNHQLGRAVSEARKRKTRGTCEKRNIWIPLKELKPYTLYQRNSNWKEGMFNYLTEKELNLLKKKGLYSSINTKGMVRDHKYSRFSGFKNNIPPILLRHPVNCQLITGAKNVSKIHKDIGYGVGNSIGLKQLFSGIKGYKKEWGEQKKCLITIATYGVII